MGVVMLTYSITGRDVSTDIHVDEDNFSKLPDIVSKAHCPHCGLMHSWWIREARLVDSIPPSRWEVFDRAS